MNIVKRIIKFFKRIFNHFRRNKTDLAGAINIFAFILFFVIPWRHSAPDRSTPTNPNAAKNAEKTEKS